MSKKNTSKLIITILSLVLIFSAFSYSFAQTSSSYNFTKDSGLDATADKAGYTEENKQLSLDDRISRGINSVLVVLGIVFIVVIVYAGITWMIALGNEDKVRKATELLSEAIIGLIVVLSAYAITWFIFNYLINNSLSTP